MAKGVGQIHLKRTRGVLEVQTMGQTPRGQKFLKGQEPIKAKHTHDKNFKVELAAAVEKLLA